MTRTSLLAIIFPQPAQVDRPLFAYSTLKSFNRPISSALRFFDFLPLLEVGSGSKISTPAPTFSRTLFWSSGRSECTPSKSSNDRGRCFVKKQSKWYQWASLPSWRNDWITKCYEISENWVFFNENLPGSSLQYEEHPCQFWLCISYRMLDLIWNIRPWREGRQP